MPRRRIKVEIKEERPDTPETPVTPIAPAPFVLPHFALPLAGNFQAGPLLFQQIAEQVRHTWNHQNQRVVPAPLNNFPRPPFPYSSGFHAVHPVPIQNIAAFQLPVVPIFQCRESALEKTNRDCHDVLSRQPGMTLEEYTEIIRNACISTGEDINIVVKVPSDLLTILIDILRRNREFPMEPPKFWDLALYALYKECQSRGVQHHSVSRIASSTVEELKKYWPTDTLPYFSDLTLTIGIYESLEPPMCEWKTVKILELQEAVINTIYCQLMGVRSDEQLPALTYLPWVVRLFRDFGLPMNDTYQVTIIDRLKRNLPHISPHYWNILSSEIQIMLTHGCNPNFITISG
ncbi:hypothetical protein B9Z55_024866 [Caenorhabditis nigoni]|uniref:Uncharacterized protein n=1 Tax=Caenorhabditis nigoni TaxID=1611254 RepID=A0A2G5SW50_9PELO|nr:hypothetical protein B9Z55_024866 [Caenorhabditis nigoni]